MKRDLSPPSTAKDPIFGVKHPGVDFPVLEESVWVEGFRIRVNVWVTTNCPDVLNDSGARRDEVSTVYIVLGDPVWKCNRERRAPPENFLYHGVDVRQITPIREARELTSANNAIQFFLGFFHSFGVEGHRQEERLQGRLCLDPASAKQWGAQSLSRRTVSAAAITACEKNQMGTRARNVLTTKHDTCYVPYDFIVEGNLPTILQTRQTVGCYGVGEPLARLVGYG